MVLIKAARSVCIRVLKEAGTAYPSKINVREYRRGNQKRKIHRNW
jgi:hypothetical protein